MAALRRGGRELRRHRRRDRLDLRRSSPPTSARRSASSSPRTNAAGSVAADVEPDRRRSPPAPPVNTALPTITGTPRDGQTLTAATGTWTGTPPITYTYQWRRCDAAGANCADIAGATARPTRSSPADVGSTIRVVVTGDQRGRQRVGDLDARPPWSPPAPPVNTALPRSPAPRSDGADADRRDRHLDRHRADHLHLPVAALRRAGASCADIAGATGATYALDRAPTSARRSASSSPRTNAGRRRAARPRAATGGRRRRAARRTPCCPAITGTPSDGQTLTATTGTWTGTAPIAYAYQWQRCDAAGASCADIAGATGAHATR